MIINAIIIISAIVAIYYVRKHAYKKGMEAGRIQVLEEDLIRDDHKVHRIDNEIRMFIQTHHVGNYDDTHAQIQTAKRERKLKMAA